MNQTNKPLAFFADTQRLKSTLRHSWLVNGDQESAAEHTWHLTLMAMSLHPYLKNKTDLEKTLKILVVHDLAEALTGDIPAFENQKGKHELEKLAFKKITSTLPNSSATKIINPFLEFEERKTPEALFAKMLDVLDVLNQHLLADISTWSEVEFKFNLSRHSEKYFLHEPVIHGIYDELLMRLSKKVEENTHTPGV